MSGVSAARRRRMRSISPVTVALDLRRAHVRVLPEDVMGRPVTSEAAKS